MSYLNTFSRASTNYTTQSKVSLSYVKLHSQFSLFVGRIASSNQTIYQNNIWLFGRFSVSNSRVAFQALLAFYFKYHIALYLLSLYIMTKVNYLNNPQVQSTVKIWPNCPTLYHQLSLPLSLVLAPFSCIPQQTPTQPHGNRCQSCKAFFNALCLIRNSDQYDCSICGCTNTFTINQIQRLFPTYRVTATQQQRGIHSAKRLLIFILDLSNYLVQSQQYLTKAINVIKAFSQNKKNVKIMILGFDDGLHHYTIGDKQLRKYTTCFEEEQHCLTEDVVSYESQFADLGTQHISTVLSQLSEKVSNNKLRNANSNAVLTALSYALQASSLYSGKIFLICGLRSQLAYFKLQKCQFHQQTKQLPLSLRNLTAKTNMSISLFFHTSNYINLRPFLQIATTTNGQLRKYNPLLKETFYYDFYYNLLLTANYQTILRVRHSPGLKLVSCYGQYRRNANPNQYQLLTCNAQRKPQFKINGPCIVQFSILYTDEHSNRYFLIHTHAVQLSLDMGRVMQSVDYSVVNECNVRQAIHYLNENESRGDVCTKIRAMCKGHLNQLQKVVGRQGIDSQRGLVGEKMKNAKLLVSGTFQLLRNFMLSVQAKTLQIWDFAIEGRNKVFTMEKVMQFICPVVYVVTKDGYARIDRGFERRDDTNVGVVIDRADIIFIYFFNREINKLFPVRCGMKPIAQVIQEQQSLQRMRQLIGQLKEERCNPYLTFSILDNLNGLNDIHLVNNLQYKEFVSKLLQ